MVLSQLQIGLAAGCAVVACLTAFGGGVIVGMWYKASEQIAPLNAALSLSAPENAAAGPEAPSPAPPEQSVTFYNTLTGSQTAYVPLISQPAAPTAPTALSVTKPGAEPATQPAEMSNAAKAVQPSKLTVVAPARESSPGAAKVTAPPKVAALPPATGTRAEAIAKAARAAAASEAQKSAKAAAPAAKQTPPAPAAGNPKPATLAQASAPKAAARERQSDAEAAVRRVASVAPTPAPGKAAAGTDYSVQVGSFGNSEQAERLRTNLAQKGYPVRVQLSEVPGQGLRYRVRVGTYADRAAADQSAHHLTAQEQVPAIVAGKN